MIANYGLHASVTDSTPLYHTVTLKPGTWGGEGQKPSLHESYTIRYIRWYNEKRIKLLFLKICSS